MMICEIYLKHQFESIKIELEVYKNKLVYRSFVRCFDDEYILWQKEKKPNVDITKYFMCA